MLNKWIVAGGWWLVLMGTAFALGNESPLPDPDQEARAKSLFYELRCVVCQSESIADSPADIASDIRRMVREKIAAGESDDEIKSHLASHYGDFILMKPPLNHITLFLWFGPLMVLVMGSGLAWRLFGKKK